MPNMRHVVVEYPSTTFEHGKSDTASLKAAFPNSPTYTMNDEAIYQSFINPPELQNGILNDGGYAFPGGVNRNYAGGTPGSEGAPNLAEVPVGGGGLPGLPYAPTIASAAESDPFNATTIPEVSTEIMNKVKGSGGFGVGDGIASPNVVAGRIVAGRRLSLGQNLPMGRSIHI
jgi:hypothetical protein